MPTRADIAAALGTVSGVSGSPFRPSVLKAGVAWPRVASHDRVQGFWASTWAVYVVLPSDEQAAATWYDANIQALRDALQHVMYVERDEPVSIPVPPTGTELLALMITGSSE